MVLWLNFSILCPFKKRYNFNDEFSCVYVREYHRSREIRGSTYAVQRGDIVTIYDEGHPRSMWRLGKVEDIVSGVDGIVQ